MFTIYGNRKSFFQWDLNQKLIVNSPICSEVHFSNVLSAEALVCRAYELDGMVVVDVPNILLTEALDIKAYIVAEDEQGCRTCNTGTFEVVKRDKPADYVYTETEVKSFDALEERVDTELNEFREQLSTIPKFAIKVVQELPPTDKADNNTIYLLADMAGGGDSLYKEYIFLDGKFELLGSANVNVDLSNYLLKPTTNGLLFNNAKENYVGTLGTYVFAPAQGQIPQAKGGGRITTNTPTEDLDCANKKYVDDKSAVIYEYISDIHDLLDTQVFDLVDEVSLLKEDSKSYITDVYLDERLEGYATQGYVDEALNNLPNYATEDFVYSLFNGYVTEVAALVGGNA